MKYAGFTLLLLGFAVIGVGVWRARHALEEMYTSGTTANEVESGFRDYLWFLSIGGACCVVGFALLLVRMIRSHTQRQRGAVDH